MMRRLAFVLLLVGATGAAACGSPSPGAPSSSPRARTGFAQETIAFGAVGPLAASGHPDFARCLTGTGEAACVSGSHLVRVSVIGASAVAPPVNLSALTSGTTVTLTWSAPTTTGVVGYIIEAGSASGLANLANFSTGSVQTSFTATGVGAGSYFVRVRAVAAAGDVSTPSNEVLVTVGPSTCAAAPGPPTALTLLSATGGAVVLAWSVPAGSPTSYILEAGSSPGLSNLANTDLRSASPGLTASGVGPGTYYVRVRATNACGISAPSNEVQVVVTSNCTVPGTPSGLTVLSVTGGTVALAWTASAGSPTSYILEAGTAPGLSNLGSSDLRSASPGLTATGVSAGTYYVRVRGTNVCGTSSPSNEVIVTVAAPSSLGVTCGTATLVNRQDETQCTAVAGYPDGSRSTLTSGVTWQTSDSSLATVTSTGLVTTVATRPGTVTITAVFQGLSAGFQIAVRGCGLIVPNCS